MKILVALHKEYKLPTDSIYIPIQVGGVQISSLKNALSDNTGDNISNKNKSYCELTALYWAWKNMDEDYIGLVHYRRYFACNNLLKNKWERIASSSEIIRALKKAPVILPKKRNYFIETTYSQYCHAHNKQDLDVTKSIIEKDYPEYIKSFDEVMNKTDGHRFNMLVMRKDILDNYCTWLFDVLSKVEKEINTENYDTYNKRVYGFLSERLLDVWINTNHISYTELPVVNLENEHWPKKIYNFLKRKFIGHEISS